MDKTNKKIGLTSNQVTKSIELHGKNIILNKKTNGFFKLLLESLSDPIIKILLIALAIKTIFLIKDFDWYETIGIVIAIFLASFISSISEYGSEKAFVKLQEESSKIKCRVKRDGNILEINNEDVVVGDIVLLSSGDKVPADGFIIEGEVSVDESALNGESKEKYKSINDTIYGGTVIYSKEALMQITEVGNNTIYGKIALELTEETKDSPLKLRLRKLAKIISIIGYIGAILITLSYLFSNIVIANHFDINLIKETLTNFPLMTKYILYALTLSVTIIVVAVPEGLPMMVTLVLSSNMKRMLKNNVLVRKLVGIETAGSLNILFTDKTGTLTKGNLEAISYINGDLSTYHSELELIPNKKLYDIVKTSLIYNNACSIDLEGRIIGGNSTDKALLNFIKTDCSLNYPKIDTKTFNSKDKYSSVTIKKDINIKLIKGAPEKILPKCTKYYDSFGEKRKITNYQEYNNYIDDIASKGIRVIILAINDNYDLNSLNNLVLVGFVLLKDEIRKEAIMGVKMVMDAGIDTIMITGDNKNTALGIGIEVGIFKSGDIILTSNELDLKTDEEIKEILPKLKIIARALPQDKSRLVRIAEEMGLVVGMTGDGVNDAPALKHADVGFAMGSGTEVAKEASDIVILDDNFLSISKAILFGRTIFKSIRKFIIFQLTINICAISLSIIGPFIGIDTPITVIQMLWINMVMDTLAGLAFSFEPPLLEYMKEPPKKKEEPILNSYMKHEIFFTGIYSAILSIIFLKLPFFKELFRPNYQDKYFMTAFFGLFIFMGIFNCFNARTCRLNLFSNILKNKAFIIVIIFVLLVQLILIYYGGDLFRTAGLTLKELEIMILISFSVIPVDILRKIFLRKKGIIGGV